MRYGSSGGALSANSPLPPPPPRPATALGCAGARAPLRLLGGLRLTPVRPSRTKRLGWEGDASGKSPGPRESCPGVGSVQAPHGQGAAETASRVGAGRSPAPSRAGWRLRGSVSPADSSPHRPAPRPGGTPASRFPPGASTAAWVPCCGALPGQGLQSCGRGPGGTRRRGSH